MTNPHPHPDVPVTLLVPVKSLSAAKTRLRATSSGQSGRSPSAHRDLVLAMAMDTIAAARAAQEVADVVVVSGDADVRCAAALLGVTSIVEAGEIGLNEALRMGAARIRARDTFARIGALNADLPALQPDELSRAIRASNSQRAFCPDRQGTGTTFLVAKAGHALDPQFGPWSAAAHEATGAVELSGYWPGLRSDVDTQLDLAAVTALRLGAQTVTCLVGATMSAEGTTRPNRDIRQVV